MRKFSLHLILLILIILAPVSYIWLKPLDKNFAFYYVKDDCYSHGMWIENRIKNTHDSINWVFIGSSHTIHAIVDYRLQDSIKAKTVANINIVSLGYCRYGSDIWYVFLKDLLKYQHPKRLFLEVACRFENINQSHIDFGYVADWYDILHVPLISHSNYFSNIKKALIIRTESYKANLFNAYDIPNANNDKWGYIPDVTAIEDEKVLSKRIDPLRKWIAGVSSDTAAYRKQFKFDSYYYNQIFNLAAIYNIPITFYYVPVYGAPRQPVDTSFFTSKTKLFIPPYYITDNKINWMDINHFNNNGAYQYTDWIMTQCLPYVNK
jgi:hypothetical protein